MAAPMRPGAQDAGHRAPRVADSSTAPPTASSATTPSANFEYDDNEWDIGIGDLIIDLDADIEKTTEKSSDATSMAANAGGPQATKAAAAKMAVEHSATVQDKGIKLKIKRTKPGTKTSEAKHEIVKSNEQQNGATDPTCDPKSTKASTTNTTPIANNTTTTTPTVNSASKRGSSGHRRDKKHEKPPPTNAVPSNAPVIPSSGSELNGVVRVSVPQTGQLRPVFPGSTGPGPPCANQGPSPGPPPSPAAATAQGSAAKPEQAKGAANPPTQSTPAPLDDRTSSPPPAKKMKTESKEVNDVCVGTSVGTITEPDCLGPCEPGTSVTLEGIVWHETEGGVLVVNVTWRGKTYVGTLLDCTRHDWAPPRFCDSPTSDLDNRTPKGRETRSSVHSKLRNGGGGAKGRRGGTNGQGPSSPTPFIPPRPESSSNKRKSRADEEAPQQTQTATATNVGKKTKVVIPPPTLPIPTPTTVASASIMSSPPSSPVLLECPEPNCSKKYKHINGLKYHQSHAHNSADDDDTKDVTSMSENDESNIEAPSPITPVKSPEPSQDSSPTTMKKEGSGLLEVSSEPNTPRSTPPLSLTPQETTNSSPSPAISSIDSKSVVKPGILRFNPTEEYPVGVFSANKSPTAGSTSTNVLPASRSSMPIIEQTSSQCDSHNQSTTIKNQPQNFSNQIPQSSQFSPNPSIINSSQSTSPPPSQPPPAISPTPTAKIGQFKVKPTAALMPEDKSKIVGSNIKISSFKKKIRKSPAGSPLSPEQIFGAEQTGREEVQSPAYSDISDDGAPPVIEPDTDKKNAKKTETGQPLPHLPQFGMYPFYGQQQYLLPPVPQQPQEKNKECADKLNDKPCDKDVKKENPVDFQQQTQPKIVHPQQHYYPYGYMPQGYPYNMDTNYSAGVPLVQEEKIKEERVKTSPSPVMENKQPTPISNPIRVPTPGKVKQEPNKDKHQNDNHQILKESIEIKNQMNPYMYPRQQAPPPPVSHHGHREDDPRRFYPYDQQRRKEQSQPQQGQTQSTPEPHKGSSSKNVPTPSPNLKSYKESKSEDKKEKEIKQEGVKPTMETQGPPPPPTSQYAYIHPSFMQSPHYGALSFDPSHPMYRGIVVPGAYTANPYLQLPRYHAPEDLSRPPPTKALDMLQHHAQYYSSHKIHELQERAIKSPTPKTSSASASPSTNSNSTTPSSGGVPPSSQMVTQPSTTNCSASSGGKQTPGESGKDSRSPPPQRHVHTHHHTHVGLGYPMYPAPYGAAVLASQQAAAVTVINPYPTK